MAKQGKRLKAIYATVDREAIVPLTQRGAARRRRVRLAGGELQLDVADDLLRHVS